MNELGLPEALNEEVPKIEFESQQPHKLLCRSYD